MPKAVVTGSSGFIGSALIARLRERGWAVKGIEANDGAGGIKDFGLLLGVTQGAEATFHLGGISGNLYIRDPREAIRVNCEGAWNVLEAARVNGVPRVIYISTSTLYAEGPLPHIEDQPLNRAWNLYAATKGFGEDLCHMFHQRHGLGVVVVRPASMYGPGEEGKGAVSNPVTQFLWSAMRGEAPIVYGDGTQTRDLLYRDDAIEGLLTLAAKGAVGETYNLSTGHASTMLEVLEAVRAVVGGPAPIFRPHAPAGYQVKYLQHQRLDPGKLVSLGWRLSVGLTEGLQRSRDYYAALPDGPPRIRS